MVKTLVSLVLIGLVLGAGALVAKVMVDTAPEPTEKPTVLPPPLVQTIRVAPETVTERVHGYGSARPYRHAELTAEVGGEVIEIGDGLEDGSPVRAGQLIARIDPRRYEQALQQKLAQAQAQEAQLAQLEVEKENLGRTLAIAESEVKVNQDEERRLADLFERDLAAKKEYDVARLAYQRSLREKTGIENQLNLIEPQRLRLQAAYNSTLAEVEMARLDVEHTRIVAPFTGQVDVLLVEEGERVQPGSRIAAVIDPQLVEVPLELPVSAYPRVGPGTQAELWVDSIPDLRWQGRVDRISPGADESSRTFRAYVLVDNREQDKPLVPGYFLSAEVVGGQYADVLLVPRGAVLEDHVLIAQDGTARRRDVRIERFMRDQAIVTGALQPGDTVIVTNLDLIEEGSEIRADPARPEGTS